MIIDLGPYILKNAEEYQKVGYGLFKLNNKGNYELLNLIDADMITEKAHDITIYEFSNLKEGLSQLER